MASGSLHRAPLEKPFSPPPSVAFVCGRLTFALGAFACLAIGAALEPAPATNARRESLYQSASQSPSGIRRIERRPRRSEQNYFFVAKGARARRERLAWRSGL